VLYGCDLLVQMKREEQNGDNRTPSEHTHGVLAIAQAFKLMI
jgi:hypothetical protein